MGCPEEGALGTDVRPKDLKGRGLALWGVWASKHSESHSGAVSPEAGLPVPCALGHLSYTILYTHTPTHAPQTDRSLYNTGKICPHHYRPAHVQV